jgi:hypothetical protein
MADRLVGALLVLLLVGTTLAFGGAVWWARPAIAAATLLLVATWMARVALDGRWRWLKSPLAPLGAMALMLAVVQLAPWPGALLRWVSPRSAAVHAHGLLPERAEADDPEGGSSRSAAAVGRAPLTVNRSATLRWLVSASVCLAVFCVVAHYADRLGRSLVVWGSVIASLFVCTTFGVVQLAGGVEGLYGMIETGKGPSWSPSTSDLLAAPSVTVLRPAGRAPASVWTVKRPDTPAAIGGLMGGPGAFLALGALGLPLAVTVLLQLLAPRGSRERLSRRLAHSGHFGLAVFLFLLCLLSAGLIGRLAGPLLCIPFAAGIVLAGLPGAWSSGLRWTALGTTVLVLGALGGGLALGQGSGPNAVHPRAEGAARAVWSEAARIARDFPIAGAGLGSFPTIHPYYKHRDEATTTARSSLLQWWAETGAAGLAILAAALTWGVVRVPGAVRRVGSADQPLAYGLLGTIVCFGLFSVLHWTVELTAVALAASAVGGTVQRWLAGGTDLLVEAV